MYWTPFYNQRQVIDTVKRVPQCILHQGHLGVGKTLVKNTLTGKNDFPGINNDTFDQFILAMTTTRVCLPRKLYERVPRLPIQDKALLWKGCEARVFLLYQTVFVSEVLDSVAQRNIYLLAFTIFRMIEMRTVAEDDERLLVLHGFIYSFLVSCRELFGDSSITFNFHRLLWAINDESSSAKSTARALSNGVWRKDQKLEKLWSLDKVWKGWRKLMNCSSTRTKETGVGMKAMGIRKNRLSAPTLVKTPTVTRYSSE